MAAEVSMRIHLVMVPGFALAVAVHGAPSSKIAINGDVPPFPASAACAQDFPSLVSPDSRARL
jgi:hypothetical protein